MSAVDHAAIDHPDALVTIDQALVAFPGLRRNTLYVAIRRDRERHETAATAHAAWLDAGYADQPEPQLHDRRIPERGTTRQKKALYRLGDIAATISDRALERNTPAAG